MNDVSVAIYEISTSGTVRLLENKASPNGMFEFGLLPGKNYRVEAHRDGYIASGWEFNTMDNSQMVFENNITIGKEGMTSNITNTSTSTTTTATMTPIESTPTSTSGITAADGTYSNPQPTMEMESETFASDSGATTINNPAPNTTVHTSTTVSTPTTTIGEAGVVYKIQLMAVRNYNSQEARFNVPKNYGTLETEYLGGKNLTRVLLSTFYTKEDAERVLDAMKSNSRDFKTSVIVRYENGVRIDPWAK